jgi:RNase H-fold protein (predicted Holliday junction resolvase)
MYIIITGAKLTEINTIESILHKNQFKDIQIATPANINGNEPPKRTPNPQNEIDDINVE